jgi:hypothetical protein
LFEDEQASLLDGLFLMRCRSSRMACAEVDICGCQVVQAFVVASVFVVLDEGVDARFELTGKVVVLKQDAILDLILALHLALGLRMTRRAAKMLDVLFV